MDEYLVYLKNEGCYGRGIIINDHYNVEYFVDGCCYNNNFELDELKLIRLLEEL
jgi:hypothetical protein